MTSQKEMPGGLMNIKTGPHSNNTKNKTLRNNFSHLLYAISNKDQPDIFKSQKSMSQKKLEPTIGGKKLTVVKKGLHTSISGNENTNYYLHAGKNKNFFDGLFQGQHTKPTIVKRNEGSGSKRSRKKKRNSS